jgi:hypothetical protein
VKTRTTLLWLACTALLTGCDSRQRQPDAGWYEIARAPGIVAYYDTARVVRPNKTLAQIWMRFVYTEPIMVGADTTTLYKAVETRQELNCAERKTRGLELRMEALGGVAVGVPAPDTMWTPIDSHPLNSGVFLVACRALGTPISARPGA